LFPLKIKDTAAATMLGPCQKPSRLFTGVCVGHSGNKQCEFLCQEGEYLLHGSCKMKMCICYVCWISMK